MRNSKRRRLLKASTLGTLGWTLASCAGTEALTTMKPSRTPLRILILGGTGYIGPHMVRQALREVIRSPYSIEGRPIQDFSPMLKH